MVDLVRWQRFWLIGVLTTTVYIATGVVRVEIIQWVLLLQTRRDLALCVSDHSEIRNMGPCNRIELLVVNLISKRKVVVGKVLLYLVEVQVCSLPLTISLKSFRV